MGKLDLHFQPGPHGAEQLFFGSRVPQSIVSRDGVFEEANGAFAAFFGYTPQEIIGQPFRRYTHPDDIHGDNAAVEDMLARKNGQTHYEMDKRYLHKVGNHSVWFHLIVDAIWKYSPDGGDPVFSHFYVVALPYPNGGRYTREERQGKVVVRPTISLGELFRDNKPLIYLVLFILAIAHPDIARLIIGLFKGD